MTRFQPRQRIGWYVYDTCRDDSVAWRTTRGDCQAECDRLNALAAGSGTAKTAKPVECEASQSGAKRNAQAFSVPQIKTYPVSLNPYAWPPCKHCGGNVNCEAYDPDTDAPLWGEEKK